MKGHKPTILFMVHLPPPVHGAALRNQSLLDSELLNASFNIIPLPLRFAESMSDLHKFSVRKLFLMVSYAVKLMRILLTRQVDLAYFTMSPAGGAFLRDVVFVAILKAFHKKRLFHFRVKGIRKTISSRWKKRLARFAFAGADVVFLSNHHLHDFEGLSIRKPYIVPNGIKIEKSSPEPEPGHASHEKPQILFLSNLSEKKGVRDLINALALVKSRGYTFEARLVGGEWDLSYAAVRDLITEAGLGRDIHVEGSKFGNEKFDILGDADIFVFPTYFELFPGVILEAMQFGKAIVTTREGSIPEMIDDGRNGILVDQRDVAALADAVAYLIDHPTEREQMGQRAREKFFSDFTLEVFEKRMLDVFTNVINRPAND